MRKTKLLLAFSFCLSIMAGVVPAFAQQSDDLPAAEAAQATPMPASDVPLTPVEQVVPNDLSQQLTDPMTDPNAITLVFDLYVGGRYQGDVVVTYTDTLLTLHDPIGALDLVPNLKDPKALLPLFRNPIETERVMPGLGRVTINRNLFRIEVSIEPQHLIIQKIDVTEENLEPEEKFTARTDFRATGSTDFDSDPTRLSVQHFSQPSFGRNRIDWQGTMNRGKGYDLTDLAYAFETGKLTYKAGLLETEGQRFAGSRSFTGFEVGTTEKTLFNNPLLEGTRLEVFVPEAAKVDIFRGDQLLFSRTLDFGLQEIDTSRFPNGSYEVEIVITDRSGTETRERRLFTRTRTLTPFGKPRWRAQAGLLRDNIDATATPVMEGSYSERVNDNIELGGSVYGGEDKLIFEGSLKTVWGSNKFESNLSWTPDNDLAIYNQYDRDFDWGNLYLNYSKTLMGHDDPENDDPSVFDALSRKNESMSFVTNLRLESATLSLKANRNRSAQGNVNYSYGPSLRYPLISKRPHRLDLNLDWVETNAGNNSGAFLRYTYSPEGRYTYTSNPGVRRTATETSFNIANTVQMRSKDATGLGLSGNLQSTTFRGSERTTQRTALGVGYKTGTSNLTMNAISNQNSNSENTQSMSLEAYTAILYADGKLAFTGNRGRDGAVLVVELTGNAKGQKMNIVANGRTIGSALVGEKVAIYLEPFRTYTFELQTADKNDLASFTTEKYVTTLYPGNVTTRQWMVNKAILAFGRVVDITGKPIAWKRLSGLRDKNVLTDGYGYFTVEYTGKETPYINAESTRCTFAMPYIQDDTEYFINVGDIVCL
ncbi:MAG: hypothetical protein GC134_09275 [Proteobacteria bacterium]|nr:hypothetical protein [Pseudomonadota bacterium]